MQGELNIFVRMKMDAKAASSMDVSYLKSIEKKYSFISEVSKPSHDLPLRYGLQGPIWRHEQDDEKK